MEVSVIVPLYNKAATVERTLASIGSQTFREFEVIVVDDGSTDGSANLVAAWPDPRVRLMRQKNAGPGRARNKGLAEARGRFVAFLDADDEWLPEFLERSLHLLESYGPSVASISSGYFQFPSGRPMTWLWESRGLRDGVYQLTPDMLPQLVAHLLAYLCPWNTLARIEVVRRWGGFFDRYKCLYAEDAHLWLKVLLNEKVAINLEPLVRFHTEASELSKNLPGPRPIEPFLRDPSEIEKACPERLQDLLRDVLAIRANKTACMLAFWGRWRAARELLDRFCPWSAWRLPYFGRAQLVANPVGAGAGKVWRWLASA
ncbi:MAG: glycosyltransferase family 2 protein [Planctomycetes bacterium]|nr:glycosyltransferase family 2 protein [Planctomycetota bacterium]